VRLDGLSAGARAALEALARRLGPEHPAWLVGGAVRDALSGGGAGDLDIAVPTGAVALARDLANSLGAAFHLLSEPHGTARLAGGAGHAWQGPQVDIADFRSGDLAGDLGGRDFTVNALAVAVEQLVADGEADVEDPTGGLRDLQARIVRSCAPRSLEDDPSACSAPRGSRPAGWSSIRRSRTPRPAPRPASLRPPPSAPGTRSSESSPAPRRRPACACSTAGARSKFSCPSAPR